MKRIAVVGSINLDYFVESQALPRFGETVTGENFFMSFGGKGANQAVAAARLGGEVAFFGSIGNDEQKNVLMEHLQKEHIDISHVNMVEGVHTGAAFIQLLNGENRIIIIPGANKFTDLDYARRILPELLQYDVVLFQLEVPMETVEYLIPALHAAGKMIILDPAPAQVLSESVLESVTYMTPNEHEFSIVTDRKESLEDVLVSFPNKLIVTCGEKGSVFHDGSDLVWTAAERKEAVDTTGAGDTFTGAFTVAVSKGRPLQECIRYATIAAGLAVTKKGAQSGMPYRQELDRLIKEVWGLCQKY